MIPGPYAGSPYYPLPGPIEAHTVLRDWLLQETGRGDLDRMSSWMLVAYGRTLGAPAGLLALAREEAAKRQRAVLEPADLHAQLRRHYPRSRVGLLTVEAIGAGIEPHIEAIAVYRQVADEDRASAVVRAGVALPAAPAGQVVKFPSK